MFTHSRGGKEKKIHQKFYDKVLDATGSPKDLKIFCSINN